MKETRRILKDIIINFKIYGNVILILIIGWVINAFPFVDYYRGLGFVIGLFTGFVICVRILSISLKENEK